MNKRPLLSEVSLFEELSEDELRTTDHISEMKLVRKGRFFNPRTPRRSLFLS